MTHQTDNINQHIVPLKTNLIVFAALMGLLILTVVADLVPLGAFNLIIALTIAIAKALLIMLYFMHVRFSSRLVWVFAGAAFLWLGILMTTLGDYMTRSWLTGPGAL